MAHHIFLFGTDFQIYNSNFLKDLKTGKSWHKSDPRQGNQRPLRTALPWVPAPGPPGFLSTLGPAVRRPQAHPVQRKWGHSLLLAPRYIASVTTFLLMQRHCKIEFILIDSIEIMLVCPIKLSAVWKNTNYVLYDKQNLLAQQRRAHSLCPMKVAAHGTAKAKCKSIQLWETDPETENTWTKNRYYFFWETDPLQSVILK